jgi:hypothetical protein
MAITSPPKMASLSPAVTRFVAKTPFQWIADFPTASLSLSQLLLPLER